MRIRYLPDTALAKLLAEREANKAEKRAEILRIEMLRPCGAKTRAGTPCQQRAIFENGRCKWHGGLSTGPKTEAGKQQSRINGRLGGRPRKNENPVNGISSCAWLSN